MMTSKKKPDLLDKIMDDMVPELKAGGPMLLVEKIMAGEETWAVFGTAPHCDARILHLPEDCEYCADRKDLQEEREALGVSNTGYNNRSWPCPADRARSGASLNSWHGNRATKDKETGGLFYAMYDESDDD